MEKRGQIDAALNIRRDAFLDVLYCSDKFVE